MKNHCFVFLCGGCVLLCCCGGGVSPPPQPPNLQLSPAGLNFGVQLVGTEGAAQTETVTNTGGSGLDVSKVGITGTNAADFNQNSTCPSNLGAGASCIIDVRFKPSQLGPRTASIAISDNGVDGTQTLSLTGDGGDSGPNATVSPTSLSFSDQDAGTTSAPQAVRLSNYGTANLDITDISASADFGETNNCNWTLASGASCTVNVTFTPGGTGNFSGTVSIADDAPDSPQTVSLSGSGSTGQCQPAGAPCYGTHVCCRGLACVQEGDRAKCESVAGFVLREP